MLTRAIPATGEHLPVIGCGTWRGFDVEPARQAPLEAVVETLFTGLGAVIDSSPMYGAAERNVGAILAKLNARERAFVATKVWTRGQAAGLQQMRQSLHRLGVACVDLMQIHYTAAAFPELESVLSRTDLDFVQLNYSAADRAAEARLLPLAQARGLAVLVNLPFGGGGLLTRLRKRPLPPCARELGCGSWAALLLKFVLAHPAVTCVIPGTGNHAHMRENLGAGTGPLPDVRQRAEILACLP
jgi:diketogulonate reductase-like aldo/keto reductase